MKVLYVTHDTQDTYKKIIEYMKEKREARINELVHHVRLDRTNVKNRMHILKEHGIVDVNRGRYAKYIFVQDARIEVKTANTEAARMAANAKKVEYVEKRLQGRSMIKKDELIDLAAKINYPHSTKELILRAEKMGIRVIGV
jgi:predicted ArsR family transcriptional regulator